MMVTKCHSDYELPRRQFIKHLGATIFLALAPRRLRAELDVQENLYISAYKNQHNQFGVALINDQGIIIKSYRLPERGHGSAISRKINKVVTFARRPGNFALAIDLTGNQKPIFFETPSYSHFYGHGVFSENGKLLFATENKYEDGEGLIGIYDTEKQFQRVGEFSTYGIGPHEIILMPDKKTLCVANGGILTHPDTGRTKLNLHTMHSSIVFINSHTGQLQGKYKVDDALKRLSLRHMDVAVNGRVWIGGQYEGDAREKVPLIASIDQTNGLYFHAIPEQVLSKFSNYVGSVSCHSHKDAIAFSSPKGNALITINGKGEVLSNEKIERVCGVSEFDKSFIYTSMTGMFGHHHYQNYWDNHLRKV